MESSSADVETLVGDFDQPAARRSAPELLATGARLGRYLVLERLGSGGMGVVYAAYDPELDRKVAIKLVSPGVAAGHESATRARLLREAQAMAKLVHPNVVAVHDVGTVDEQVFVAMDFIDGGSLREWMVGGPRGWKEVLGVLRQAGLGIAAAHERGLVHRDFKPDNVMLGQDGRVVVMDFGLVRATARSDSELVTGPSGTPPTASHSDEGRSYAITRVTPQGPDHAPSSTLLGGLDSQHALDSMLTEVGSLLGTPAYMAPEQFAGAEADARSDQFSFCVTLYEALYRERPFAGRTVIELMMAITSGELRPEPRGTMVPRWLRAVVLRGLSFEPDRRYASVTELLAALDRDPSFRRRVGALAGGVAVLGLLATGVGLELRELRTERAIAACEAEGAAIHDDWNPDTRATLEAALVATQSPYAQTSVERMATWLDRYTTRWANERTEICLRATVEQTLTPELHAQANACFDEQRARLVAMLEVFGAATSPMVAGAAKAAASFSQLDSCADERLLLQQAILPGSIFDDPKQTAKLARVRRELARASALVDGGDPTGGLAAAREGLASATTLGWAPLQAEARLAVASILGELGDFEEVVRELQITFRLASGSGNDALAAKTAIMLLRVLGYQLARTGEGLAWAEVAGALLERLDQLDGLDAAQLANNTALVHEVLGQLDESERFHRRALALRELLLSPDHPETGHSYGNLGNLALQRGDLDEALALQLRALEVRTQGLGPSHPDVARSHLNAGRVYLARGQLDDALDHISTSYTIFEQTFGPKHRTSARVLVSLGEVQLERGQFDDALVQFELALAVQRELLGPKHPETAETMLEQATALTRVGRLGEAQSSLDGAASTFESALGIEHRHASRVAEVRAELCAAGHVPACS